jgi:hypothetical protein
VAPAAKPTGPQPVDSDTAAKAASEWTATTHTRAGVAAATAMAVAAADTNGIGRT